MWFGGRREYRIAVARDSSFLSWQPGGQGTDKNNFSFIDTTERCKCLQIVANGQVCSHARTRSFKKTPSCPPNTIHLRGALGGGGRMVKGE